MIDWDKITDEEMRADVVQGMMRRRDECTKQAERCEKSAEDPARIYRHRREDAACARYSRRQAAHYQQAIDLLTAAPMPMPPLVERVTSAVAILREKGFDAFTVTGSAIGVRSRLAPTYCVTGTDREGWSAERIAEDIARNETEDATAAPMPPEPEPEPEPA